MPVRKSNDVYERGIGVRRFKVTDAHLKLARQMVVRWGQVEFGAPEIDGKRPYGNSDVIGDMLKILGLPDAEERPETLVDYLTTLHGSMKTALQIFLATGTFETGIYEAGKYGRDWRRVTS
jgi:hypothetical protein